MKGPKLGAMLLIAFFSMSCGQRDASLEKADVLSQMRQSLGLSADVSIYAMADCTGPSSTFKTLVMSGSSNTRFEQKSGPRHMLGIHRPDSSWLHDFVADTSVAVDSATIAFLINHELHATALYPETRYGHWVSEKDTTYYNEEARMLIFKDIKGGSVKTFYKSASWLPLGFSIENHLGRGAGQVDVLFDNWRVIDGVRTFTEASFFQGADVYHYQFTEILFGKLPEGVFTKNEPLILP